MKIQFLTEDNPRYLLPFFEEFCRNYAGEFEITYVSCCRSMGRRSRIQLLRELALLYSPVGLSKLLSSLVFARMMGAFPKTRRARHFYTIAQLCRAYDIPCERIGNPNSADFRAKLESRKPDVIASVACPYILKDALLSLPIRGCINIHHGPLPRYRGMMPSFWQLFHGERRLGVTVHRMVPQIDQGAILFQDDIPVKSGETLDSVIQRSKRHGAHCVAQVLRQFQVGTERAVKCDPTEGSYFTFPTLAEIREFRKRGYRAI